MNKFKKGDLVIITTGKDKNKTGKILNVFPKENKVVVEGLNIAKKHLKRNENSEIVDFPAKIDVSNVSHYSEKTKTKFKVKFEIKDKLKVRVSKTDNKALK